MASKIPSIGLSDYVALGVERSDEALAVATTSGFARRPLLRGLQCPINAQSTREPSCNRQEKLRGYGPAGIRIIPKSGEWPGQLFMLSVNSAVPFTAVCSTTTSTKSPAWRSQHVATDCVNPP